jgi:hypothetical protein
MKRFVDKEIRKIYREVLKNLTVNGYSIPVLNLARIGQKPPFIMILNQSQGEAVSKATDCCYTDITLQCVTSAAGDFGGDEFADDIADAVLQRLFPDYGENNAVKIITAKVTGSEMLRLNTNTDLHIIRQLVINHFIQIKN